MKNPKVRQVVLPLITALIWGSAFVTQSLSAAHLGCFSFNALRAIPAVLVLLVLLAVMQRIHPREKYSAEEKRALLRGGLVCGAFLALAINLQQFGMGTTSAGKAGFITALYIVLVPVFSTVLGKKAKKSIWLCVIAAVAGLYFLCFDGESAFSVRMSAAEVAYAPLLNVGDRVCVYYRDGYVTENWIEASDVELLDGSAQSAPPVETSVSTEDSADPVENAQEMP